MKLDNVKISVSSNLELSQVYLDKTVKVAQNVKVGKRVSVLENVEIGLNSEIGRGTVVDNESKIGKNVIIGEFCKIGKNVVIGDNIELPNRSEIDDNTDLSETLVLNGTKHESIYLGNGKLMIGCMINTIDWWLENYVSVGLENGYTESQIAEYKGYIDQNKLFHDEKLK